MRTEHKEIRQGALAGWLLERGLLRGPFVFSDYWASVLRLEAGDREARTAAGLVDRGLFRLGIDRPELELPRLRYYLLLFFAGPLLLPFRFFRRVGRYRIRVRSGMGEQVLEALEAYRLDLEPSTAGRVSVRRPAAAGGGPIAEDLADPLAIGGFTSLFLAAYKLPLAASIGVVVAALMWFAAGAVPFEPEFGRGVVAAGYLLVTAFLWVLFRDGVTALLGAIPVVVVAVLYDVLRIGVTGNWGTLAGWLVVLLGLYVAIDLFFFPRPVPPALFLYTRDGDGSPYRRSVDAPWWLEGDAYWVWRYLMLTPAEVNKFWERDWERVDLWIRADGRDAGQLEWVVTDGHYRELWTPLERLVPDDAVRDMRQDARAAARGEGPGTWMVEVDANLLFHTPYVRTVSFLADEGRIPARRLIHVLRAMWSRPREPRLTAALARLAAVRLTSAPDLLGDLPEVITERAARHLLSLPWTHWRYPFAANRPRAMHFYDRREEPEPGAAADPDLQIKANHRESV